MLVVLTLNQALLVTKRCALPLGQESLKDLSFSCEIRLAALLGLGPASFYQMGKDNKYVGRSYLCISALLWPALDHFAMTPLRRCDVD